jgi:hypothetical protein
MPDSHCFRGRWRSCHFFCAGLRIRTARSAFSSLQRQNRNTGWKSGAQNPMIWLQAILRSGFQEPETGTTGEQRNAVKTKPFFPDQLAFEVLFSFFRKTLL